jgi:uncharacterized protein YjbI with pentapeptide repeats
MQSMFIGLSTKASNANFSGANLKSSSLDCIAINANFSGADLSNCSLRGSTLTGAVFTGAKIVNVSFEDANVTAAQLSSTASYQDRNFGAIKLDSVNLTNMDLSSMNLAGATFFRTTLTGASLTNSNIAGMKLSEATSFGLTANQVYSTATYANRNMQGIDLSLNDLSDWNFEGQDLSNVRFIDSTLANANLANAVIAGASFYKSIKVGSMISAQQLYSTASYQSHDLRGIVLYQNDITGWDFSRQRLDGANLGSATITNANFSQASLVDVNFAGAGVTSANLRGADARGAGNISASAANFANGIWVDGKMVFGMNLIADELMIIRDYDGDPTDASPTPIPIKIMNQCTINATATLQMIFESDPWDSVISFNAGIPVQLGGKLDLEFAPNTDLQAQIGRTIRIFNWTGVTPVGSFNIIGPYQWDLSNLYTTGEVTLLALASPGDFDGDGDVDGADFVTWQTNYPKIGGALGSEGDADGDGDVDGADFVVWQTNFPTQAGGGSSVVPEPAAGCLGVLFALAIWHVARRQVANG